MLGPVMSVRHLLIVASSSVMMATPIARAADAPAVYEEIRPTVHDWTGIYAGLHVGHGWGIQNVTIVNGEDPPIATGGVLLGAQIGANYQIDSFVVGVEADWSWTDMSGEDWRINEFLQVETDWLATVRLRAGYDFGELLVYGTGGIAFIKNSITLPVTAESDSLTHTGWTIGGGLEAMLTENLSAKAEYLYLDFPTERYTMTINQADSDTEMQLLRLGVNYRLPL